MNCLTFHLSDYLASIAIVVSLATFLFSFFQNKKSRKIQVQTTKLEELLELILELSKYYPKFKQLYFETEKYYEQNNNDINSIGKYFTKRDSIIPSNEQIKIEKLLSRIDVLHICYTKNKLHKDIEIYFNIMDTFYDCIINLNNSRKSIKCPNGFPSFEDEKKLIDNITKNLKQEIHKYY